jgi:hypothetical protein
MTLHDRSLTAAATTADAPTLFSNAEVQAALSWKYGHSAEYVDVPSVWQLLDEFRARARDKEAKP